MIFTSYFAQLKSLPENVIPIAICGKTPAGYDGLIYEKLAPKYKFFMEWKKNHDNNYYIECFNEQILSKLDTSQVIKELYDMLDDSLKDQLKIVNCPPWERKDIHVALICYENPDNFCHRHLVASWLIDAGFDVDEWQKEIFEEYVIAVTGHRPNKLYGYDTDDERYISLKEQMKEFLIKKGCTKAVSGMALGVDQLFAEAVIELKESGYNIKLHCAIPCRNHPCKWPKKSQEHYQWILSKADEVVLVTDAVYSPWLMQVRNKFMVNMADEVLAIWDGSEGGTGNCVKYANETNKKVTIINP